MEASKQPNPFKDGIFITGLFFIVISFILFCFPEWKDHRWQSDSMIGIFFLNFILTCAYGIILFVKGLTSFKNPDSKSGIAYMPILLVLFSISAYTLNQDIPIFSESTPWLTIVLLITHLALIAFSFRHYFPNVLKLLLYFILGTATILFTYYSIYLAPYYPFCATVCWFFGISLHIFVPLLQVIYLIYIFINEVLPQRQWTISFLSGAAFSIAFTFYFCTVWSYYSQTLNHEYGKAISNEANKLPTWVKASQKMPSNWIVERILKADILYAVPSETWRFFDMPRKNFNNPEHDPLVMVASLFCGKPELDNEDKYKIIESLYDARHESEERLWSGDKLETANVTTNIKLMPQYRISYTEKFVSIKNKANKDGWRGRQEEAIYTFTLPEGSVVTSLSLWINGKEEKGYLTTKAKADSAYKTIVGVESRDPSVIHWKEGNTVSVRVFPCTPEENRRFKIGITSPLRKDKDKLVYENIYFKGPSFNSATEVIQINSEEKIKNIQFPFSFDEDEPMHYLYEGSYTPYWELSFDAPTISNNAFTFDGKSYLIENYEKVYERFSPEKIYLDLNQSWTEEEFEITYSLFKSKQIYVFTESLLLVTEENKNHIFKKLSQIKFSMFPIYEIKEVNNALLISKNDHPSPYLKDLKESQFATLTKEFLGANNHVRLFNLNGQLSPYLKTLKEFRTFTYDTGDINYLSSLVNENKFIKPQEDNSCVVIENACIKIKELDGNLKQTAPDHLLRLYTYNNILKNIGKDYFNDDFIKEKVISQAQKAYVVSPVSSLIVLESQNDYERFGITEANNSLKNASMNSSGAVPEPHEWFLIILGACTIVYLKFRNDLKFI